jgi:multisubunit Na+/H+ antiporter MnhG subunit
MLKMENRQRLLQLGPKLFQSHQATNSVFLFIIVEGFIMTQLLFLALFFLLTFPVSVESVLAAPRRRI